MAHSVFGLLRIENEPPIMGEPSKEASNQAVQQALEALESAA